jgi:hypothetical protein
LLDDVVLPDDHLLQFFLHQLSMLGELLEDVVERLRTGGGGHAAILGDTGLVAGFP